jgi:hypothetical protein
MSSEPFARRVSPAVEAILRDASVRRLLPDAGFSAVRDALALIASEGPGETRSVAQQILASLPESNAAAVHVDDESRYNLNGAVTFSAVPTVTLFTAENRTGLTYEVVLHEFSHLAIAVKYKSIRDVLSRSLVFSTTEIEESAALHFARFAKIWQEFKSASSGERFSDRNLEIAVTDARSSPDEFFARSLTDPQFQTYLSEKRYEGRTIWSRFKNWVKKSLFDIQHDSATPSWLDAALIASTDLLSSLTLDKASTAPTRPHQPATRQSRDQTASHEPLNDASGTNISSSTESMRRHNNTPQLRALHQEDTVEFNDWFRSSKAISSNGRPLIVYHATASSVTEFSPGDAIYFTDDREIASLYSESATTREGGADDTTKDLPVYLSLQNPIILDEEWAKENLGYEGERDRSTMDNILYDAKTNGYDGAILRGVMNYAGSNESGKRAEKPYDKYVVFSPEQIKSAVAYDAKFDPTDTNIFHARDSFQENSPEFKHWFGASQVVDPSTKQPRVVYHGTANTFDAFKPTTSKSGHPSAAAGFFFTESPRVAERFNRDLSDAHGFFNPTSKPFASGANTMPVYLAIENPKIITAAEFKNLMSDLGAPPTDKYGWLRTPDGWRALRATMEAEGFDGMKIGIDRNHYPGSGNEEFASTQWVAFRPEQIKSATGNIGTFDPNDPSILRSRDVHQENSEEFLKWFSNSEVVEYGTGRPRVVYHGTTQDIQAFDRLRISDEHGKEGGFFFTPDATRAAPYANDEGANIMPVYLSIKNPFRIDPIQWMAGMYMNEDGDTVDIPTAPELMRQGFDGIIIDGDSTSADDPDWEFGNDVYIAFSPQQIKSALGNGGAFDPNDPDINMSRNRAQENTTEFENWFRNSGVCDEHGAPLVVYHGTAAKFNAFDPTKVGSTFELDDQGFYFTTRQETAEMYADHASKKADGGTPHVIPAYVSLQNPWVIYVDTSSETGQSPIAHFEGGKGVFNRGQRYILSYAVDSGYDGVIIRDKNGMGEEHEALVIALYPTQIKSATLNRGSFDPNDPDMLMSRYADSYAVQEQRTGTRHLPQADDGVAPTRPSRKKSRPSM